MGKSSGGGGGGGKGKSISGSGGTTGGDVAAAGQTAAANSRFTPEEQAGINRTVEKLRALSKEERSKGLKQMQESLRSRLDDAKKAENDALRRQSEWRQRNPDRPADRNHFNEAVEKAQARLKSAKSDWNKFVAVNNAFAK